MHEVVQCPICKSPHLSFYFETRDYHLTNETFSLRVCDTCGLILTSPRPATDRLPSYYASSDYISHTARATSPLNRAYLFARKFTLRQKLALVERFVPTGRILDFGCGTGEFLKVAHNHSWDIHGVEPAENARRAAEKYLPNIHPDLQAIPSSHLHAITLWHVLEHLPLLNETLGQLKHRLRDDGVIFIAVPNIKSFDAQHYGSAWAGLDVPRHLWHFSQRNMLHLLQNHQLTWIETIPMKLDAYYVSLLSEKYRTQNTLSLPAVYKAIRTGLKSNIKARRTTEYSSLIYVAKK